MPFDLGPPVWVDDAGFDLGYHLSRTALPSPGGDTELAELIGRLMSRGSTAVDGLSPDEYEDAYHRHTRPDPHR